MAATLTALALTWSNKITGSHAKGIDLTTPAGAIDMTQNLGLTFGTGAGAANSLWTDRRILAGGADEGTAIDLAAVLVDAFGDTLTFANVKLIAIFNRSDVVSASPAHAITTAAISVGDTAANEFQGPFHAAGDGIIVQAGASFIAVNPLAAGWAVTAATGDIMLISNEDGSNEAMYDILIAGEST